MVKVVVFEFSGNALSAPLGGRYVSSVEIRRNYVHRIIKNQASLT